MSLVEQLLLIIGLARPLVEASAPRDRDLEYLPRDAYAARYNQLAEVQRMLYRFMQSLSAPGLTAESPAAQSLLGSGSAGSGLSSIVGKELSRSYR